MIPLPLRTAESSVVPCHPSSSLCRFSLVCRLGTGHSAQGFQASCYYCYCYCYCYCHCYCHCCCCCCCCRRLLTTSMVLPVSASIFLPALQILTKPADTSVTPTRSRYFFFFLSRSARPLRSLSDWTRVPPAHQSGARRRGTTVSPLHHSSRPGSRFYAQWTGHGIASPKLCYRPCWVRGNLSLRTILGTVPVSHMADRMVASPLVCRES